MSQQNETKPIDLFLKNTSSTGQKKNVDIVFFISNGYSKMLETAYKDEHVIIRYIPTNRHAHIDEFQGKLQLSLASSTMDKMMGINAEDFNDFDDSKLNLFVKNYDHIVNAFKKISDSYTINDDQFTGMTVFGQPIVKPIIAIKKTEHVETVTTYNVGYYVSDRVQEWIRKTQGIGCWSTSDVIMQTGTNQCFKRTDGELPLAVRTGKYVEITDRKIITLSKASQNCFIDNFDVIVECFKLLKAEMEIKPFELDTTNGIVF